MSRGSALRRLHSDRWPAFRTWGVAAKSWPRWLRQIGAMMVKEWRQLLRDPALFAFGLVVLLLVMPIVMLSGTWNLVESMPPWLRTAINLSPLRHFIDIAYGVLLKGADASMLALHAAKMALLGTAFFVAGVWRFRRQFR